VGSLQLATCEVFFNLTGLFSVQLESTKVNGISQKCSVAGSSLKRAAGVYLMQSTSLRRDTLSLILRIIFIPEVICLG